MALTDFHQANCYSGLSWSQLDREFHKISRSTCARLVSTWISTKQANLQAQRIVCVLISAQLRCTMTFFLTTLRTRVTFMSARRREARRSDEKYAWKFLRLSAACPSFSALKLNVCNILPVIFNRFSSSSLTHPRYLPLPFSALYMWESDSTLNNWKINSQSVKLSVTWHRAARTMAKTKELRTDFEHRSDYTRFFLTSTMIVKPFGCLPEH